jgi:sarcosine oxidase subunit beta
VAERPGFFLDVGWGTWGFKAAPVAGLMTAQCVATGAVPELIQPFRLERFYEDRLVGEKAAAAVSH